MPKPQGEEKIVFGLGAAEGAAFMLLGVPEAAWEYMKDGKIHHLDLSSLGFPIKVMLFGAKDRAEAIKIIEDHNQRQGLGTLHVRDRDFGIKT